MENFNSNDRKFRGIWIPAELWLKDDMSLIEIMLLSEIISLDKGPGCRATNEYFAKFLKTTEVSISRYIKKLKKLRYIEEISFDGRKRYLKSFPERITKDSSALTKCLGSFNKIKGAALTEIGGLPYQERFISIDNIIDNLKDILLLDKKTSLICLEKIGLIKKKTKKTKKYNENSIQYKLAEFLYREIESQDPIFAEPNLQKWASIFNTILYVDKKDPDEIKKIISWTVRDNFHQTFFVTPMYLRNKYEMLRKQCNKSSNNSNRKETAAERILRNAGRR